MSPSALKVTGNGPDGGNNPSSSAWKTSEDTRASQHPSCQDRKHKRQVSQVSSSVPQTTHGDSVSVLPIVHSHMSRKRRDQTGTSARSSPFFHLMVAVPFLFHYSTSASHFSFCVIFTAPVSLRLGPLFAMLDDLGLSLPKSNEQRSEWSSYLASIAPRPLFFSVHPSLSSSPVGAGSPQ